MAFDQDLQTLLVSSRAAILSRTRSGITNTNDFRRLLAVLQSFSNKIGAELFAIIIDLDNVARLDFTRIDENLNNEIAPDLQLKNHFLVDQNFSVSSKTRTQFGNSSEARLYYSEMSKNNKCVILSGKRLAYPHYFVEGEDIGNAPFFTEADYKRFRELRDISDVLEVIEDFRVEISHYTTYSKFFVPKTILKIMFGDDKNNYIGKGNILRNKPEDHLRQELKNYLNNHINRSFNFYRETHMDNSSRRLDIIGEDEVGNIYFFEVKWMGKSIGPDDIKITSDYNEEKILQGTEQTLQYINEWQTNKRIVKMGCLVVFDGRNNKSNYLLPKFLQKYNQHLANFPTCVSKFRKIEDLKIDNTYPS